MKRLVLAILLLATGLFAKAQVPVGTPRPDVVNSLLIEQLERMAEDSDDEVDFEELLEHYIFLSDNPVDLNSDEVMQLVEMRLMSAFQYEALQQYRRYYGDFLFLEELEMVEGLDEQTISLIAPLVYIGPDRSRDKISLSQLARYGKHQIVGRYEQILEPQAGYADISDSALLASPNSRYVGSPQHYELRYSYNYRNKIRAGFVVEKDPGERSLCDFVGFHLYAKDLGIVKAAVAGDYQLSFGQGLTMWSGVNFGKAFAGSSVMKQGRGISPKSSANETLFMRGAATTIGIGPVKGTVFYSNRLVDANISVADSLDEAELVSSLQETGYHRTLGELQDRHAVRQQVVGGHLAYATEHLEVGYTGHYTWLNVPLQPKPTNYNQYYFQGRQLTNHGIDFKYAKGRFALFGEVAMSIGEGDRGSLPVMRDAAAGLVGLSIKPAGYLNFTLMYRDYGKAYQNLFSRAYGEGSRCQGQRGVYLGAELAPAPYWNLLVYSDLFKFTWLTSQVNAPNWGHDYYLRLSHSFSKRVSAFLQIRSKTKMKNSTDAYVFSHYPVFYTKNSLRFDISYQIGRDFHLSNKAEYAHYKNGDGDDSQGFFLCQDVAYKPENKSFSLTFRYAVFDTEDYDARVYAYENDVLYSFSVPAFYGKGMRVYLLGKWQPFKCLTLYARIGSTIYTDRDEIGSGLSLIEGNHRTDVKVEAIWKF